MVLLAAAMLLGTATPVYAQEATEAVSENSSIVYFSGTEGLAGNAARYALIYKIGIGHGSHYHKRFYNRLDTRSLQCNFPGFGNVSL